MSSRQRFKEREENARGFHDSGPVWKRACMGEGRHEKMREDQVDRRVVHGDI